VELAAAEIYILNSSNSVYEVENHHLTTGTLGSCNLVLEWTVSKDMQGKVTCLVTANDKQGWICRMENTWSELSPAAVKLIHKALIIQRPHLHCVFTDRHHIFASGIPAHGINILSVALQFPGNQTIRVAFKWSLLNNRGTIVINIEMNADYS
jgi:hypothetical protein